MSEVSAESTSNAVEGSRSGAPTGEEGSEHFLLTPEKNFLGEKLHTANEPRLMPRLVSIQSYSVGA